eukprot:15610-Heterococcus_DN1.PRE.3
MKAMYAAPLVNATRYAISCRFQLLTTHAHTKRLYLQCVFYLTQDGDLLDFTTVTPLMSKLRYSTALYTVTRICIQYTVSDIKTAPSVTTTATASVLSSSTVAVVTVGVGAARRINCQFCI